MKRNWNEGRGYFLLSLNNQQHRWPKTTILLQSSSVLEYTPEQIQFTVALQRYLFNTFLTGFLRKPKVASLGSLNIFPHLKFPVETSDARVKCALYLRPSLCTVCSSSLIAHQTSHPIIITQHPNPPAQVLRIQYTIVEVLYVLFKDPFEPIETVQSTAKAGLRNFLFLPKGRVIIKNVP